MSTTWPRPWSTALDPGLDGALTVGSRGHARPGAARAAHRHAADRAAGGAGARHRAAAAPGRACCRRRRATWPSWSTRGRCRRRGCGRPGGRRRTTTRPVWGCCSSRCAGAHAVAARRVDRKDAALGAAGAAVALVGTAALMRRRRRKARRSMDQQTQVDGLDRSCGRWSWPTCATSRCRSTRCSPPCATRGRRDRLVRRHGARPGPRRGGRRPRLLAHPTATDGLRAVCAARSPAGTTCIASRPCTGSATSRSATWRWSSAASAAHRGEAFDGLPGPDRHAQGDGCRSGSTSGSPTAPPSGSACRDRHRPRARIPSRAIRTPPATGGLARRAAFVAVAARRAARLSGLPYAILKPGPATNTLGTCGPARR